MAIRWQKPTNATASDERRGALPRGTRGKASWQPAFKVAHLAAGGCFLVKAIT